MRDDALASNYSRHEGKHALSGLTSYNIASTYQIFYVQLSNSYAMQIISVSSHGHRLYIFKLEIK